MLHNVTQARQTRKGIALPFGVLSHDIAEAITLLDGCFYVNPKLFSQAVVHTVEADFAVFAGISAGTPPLPAVRPLDPAHFPPTYLGTSAS